MSEYDGKVVVVTGAAGNLGSAVVDAFAERGAKVALLDRETERLAARADGLPAQRAIVVAVDLLDQSSVDQAIQQVTQALGPVDVLANIAGGFTMGTKLHETPDEDWNLMLDLNARSILHTCRATLPGMLEHGSGRIVNIAARAALEGKSGMGAYCASKAAVITLTETLAAEHKLANINANCILPGTIDTPENRQAMPDADHSRWVPTAALADVVVFLASRASRAITGAAIPVYGQS